MFFKFYAGYSVENKQ